MTLSRDHLRHISLDKHLADISMTNGKSPKLVHQISILRSSLLSVSFVKHSQNHQYRLVLYQVYNVPNVCTNDNIIVLKTSTLTPQGFAIALQPITNVNGQPIFYTTKHFKGTKLIL